MLKIFFDPQNRKIDPRKIEHFPIQIEHFLSTVCIDPSPRYGHHPLHVWVGTSILGLREAKGEVATHPTYATRRLAGNI